MRPAPGSMILWGMGICQHIHGTDNARCLIALALMTGQIGKPGSGLHPLRGQNNVQGASDAGLIPMIYPDYQRVDDPEARRAVRESLECAARNARRQAGADRGRDHQGHPRRQCQGHVHHGRKSRHVRSGRRSCARGARQARHAGGAGYFPHRNGVSRRRDSAGLIVCREDGHVHQHRSMRAAGPAGAQSARQGAAGFGDHHRAGAPLGLSWNYGTGEPAVAAVFDEMRHTMPSIGGITWERLEAEDSVTYPCVKEGDPGDPVVFIEVVPDADRQGEVRSRRHHSRRRAAGHRVSDGA